MRASFNGHIPEIPGIAVDNFKDTVKRAYFLSHCHGDHTTGLDHFYESVCSGTVFIYMSEPSAAILLTNVDRRLKKFIKPLKLGSSTICIPGDEIKGVQELYLRVTLIPAGHCFGSVMFLFETPLKKVLYTGDFRITENGVSKMAQLHDRDGKPIKLDVLYVDTTFQDINFEIFPKRSETIEEVVRGMKKWLSKSDNHRVSLVPSARYGYEDIFNKIYQRMNMKVYTKNNWELYSKFLDRLPGVTNSEMETKIHSCSKSYRFCECYQDSNHKYLYIYFSAMKWQNFKPEDLAVVTDSTNSMSVCFSTHCSRSELVYFVEYLAPKKVVGFSEPYRGVTEPTIVTPSKRKSKSAEKAIAEDRPKKIPKSLLRKIFG